MSSDRRDPRTLEPARFHERLSTGLERDAARARLRALERAHEHLLRAEGRAQASRMKMVAAMTRHRRGELLGGDTGRGLCDAARRVMVEQLISRPERMLAVLAPEICPR